MKEYNFHWFYPGPDHRQSIRFFYDRLVFGRRSSEQMKTRIAKEAALIDSISHLKLKGRLTDCIYYLQYLSNNISQNGMFFPWSEVLWSSEIMTTALSIPFSPLENGIPLIAKDFNELVMFPEPDDLPALILIVNEKAFREVKELTKKHAAFVTSLCGLDMHDSFRFDVRLIPVEEKEFARLTCFPTKYRKSIVKRLPSVAPDSVPDAITGLFPFVTGNIKPDIGGKEPSFSHAVDKLAEELERDYCGLSKTYAFVYMNYLYNTLLDDAIEKAASKEKQFMQLIPKNTLLGFNHLEKFNEHGETPVSTEMLLFDFKGFGVKHEYERRLLLERSYWKYYNAEWFGKEAKDRIIGLIRETVCSWPSCHIPVCMISMLRKKEAEAADIILSWTGGRGVRDLSDSQIEEYIFEAASLMYRKYMYSPETVVVTEEEKEDGVPYDEMAFYGDYDYINEFVLKPDDRDYERLERAEWVIVHYSNSMICSKIGNFITTSKKSDESKKLTFQIVSHRMYEDVKTAVADIGTEALGLGVTDINSAVSMIKEANKRHGVTDEDDNVVALKIMPFNKSTQSSAEAEEI